jgi:hypothetical protein
VFVNPLVENQLFTCLIKSALLLKDEFAITSFTWSNLSKYVEWFNKLLPARTAVQSVPAHKCKVTVSVEFKPEILS